MKPAQLLHSKEAQTIYRDVAKCYKAEELTRFIYTICAYCNELALYHKIEKELATLDSVVVLFTNNKNKTNERKHELTRARAESRKLLSDWEKELRLTPKTYGQQTEEASNPFDEETP